MKKNIWILLFAFVFVNFSQAQSKYKEIVGDWVWKNGNEMFQVHFYEEEGIVKGDYQLVKIDENKQEKILYKSNKLINKEFDFYYGHAINVMIKGTNISGVIRDNVLLGNNIHTVKSGELTISLNKNNTAKWSIRPIEVFDNNKALIIPDKFIIPTNIKLTKVR